MNPNPVTNLPIETGETDQLIFEAQLPPGELERILARIEENLVFRQQFDGPDGTSIPVVGSVTFLEQQLQAIKELNAPYFRPHLSHGAGVWLRKAINKVLWLFGYKQAQFNTQLIDTLQATVVYLYQELSSQRQSAAALRGEIEQLRQQLADNTPTNHAGR